MKNQTKENLNHQIEELESLISVWKIVSDVAKNTGHEKLHNNIEAKISDARAELNALNLENKLIEVCSECLTASCYHGEFMCFEARTAGTELKIVKELRNLKYENPYNWSDENLNKIYGEPSPNGYGQNNTQEGV